MGKGEGEGDGEGVGEGEGEVKGEGERTKYSDRSCPNQSQSVTTEEMRPMLALIIISPVILNLVLAGLLFSVSFPVSQGLLEVELDSFCFPGIGCLLLSCPEM